MKKWTIKIQDPTQNINHNQLLTILLELQQRMEALEEMISKITYAVREGDYSPRLKSGASTGITPERL